MDKLREKVHQYRMEHGYPEYEEELLRFAEYFYKMGHLDGQRTQVV